MEIPRLKSCFSGGRGGVNLTPGTMHFAPMKLQQLISSANHIKFTWFLKFSAPEKQANSVVNHRITVDLYVVSFGRYRSQWNVGIRGPYLRFSLSSAAASQIESSGNWAQRRELGESGRWFAKASSRFSGLNTSSTTRRRYRFIRLQILVWLADLKENWRICSQRRGEPASSAWMINEYTANYSILTAAHETLKYAYCILSHHLLRPQSFVKKGFILDMSDLPRPDSILSIIIQRMIPRWWSTTYSIIWGNVAMLLATKYWIEYLVTNREKIF